MSIQQLFLGTAAGGGEAYQVANSLRFNDDDSAYLNKPFSQGNQQTWTYSCWVKRASFGVTKFGIFGRSNNDANIVFSDDSGGNVIRFIYPNANISKWSKNVYRDPSAWYHIVCTLDTNNGTQEDRLRFYINGERVTDWHANTLTDLTQGVMLGINSANAHEIGRFNGGSYFDGLISEVNFVDGQQLDHTSFGETDATTGQWVPIEYTHSTSAWHTVNDGTDWSSYGTGGSTNYPLARATDGDLSTLTIGDVGANTVWNFGSLFSSATKVRFYAAYGGGAFTNAVKIDSTDVSSYITATGYAGAWTGDIAVSGFTTITSDRPLNHLLVAIMAIEVDGVVLVNNAVDNSFHLKFDNTSDLGEDSSGNDNDFTANNLTATSNEVTVASADGGLPIYNTTGDDGDVKGSGYRTDSDSSSLVLAIPMDGADSGTSFTDYHSAIKGSGSAKTVTATGVTTETEYSKFYGSSAYFTGAGNTSSYLSIPDSTDLDFQSSWTIECWVYFTRAIGTQEPIYASNSDFKRPAIFRLTNGKMGYFVSSNGSSWNIMVGDGAATGQGSSTIASGVWNHVVFQWDGSTYKGYVNGVLDLSITSSTASYNASDAFTIGRWGVTYSMQGYISDFRVYKGVAKYSSAFTVPTRQTNFADIDVLADSPSTYDDGGDGVGNYCTLNPLQKGAATTLSNGNLNYVGAVANQTLGTIGVTSGKWYWEDTKVSGTYGATGIALADAPITNHPGQGNSWTYNKNGTKWTGGASSSYAATWGSGDTIGIAFDADAGSLTFYKNGVSQGVAYTGLTNGPYFSTGCDYDVTGYYNYGARSFKYAPPTGYKALNTFNLPDPTITDPSLYFDTKLFTGDNSTDGSKKITYDFSPDLYWQKSRSAAYHNRLFDSIRGQGSLVTDQDFAEGTDANSTLTSFDSDGVSIENTANELGNSSGVTYVAWAWDAASSNTSISVGDYNSSTYNQSQTWSTAGTASGTTWGPAVSTLFNGDISDGPSVWPSGNDGTWTFTSPPTASSSIKIYTSVGTGTGRTDGTTGTYIKLTVSGTDHIINAAAGLADTGLTGTLDAINITVQSGSGSPGLRYVEIDGKLLVDDTVTINSPSIASTVRANPSAGFSIATYTGNGSNAIIGHGLNTAPEMLIIKRRNDTDAWPVYHGSLGNTQKIYLNLTNAAGSGDWQNTSPTSTVWSTGSGAQTNDNGSTYVCYAFAPVEGYSKFSSFEGNNSTDGPYIALGFRPAMILIKNIADASWAIYDNKRDTFNGATKVLNPDGSGGGNANDAWVGSYPVDFLSNGFKLRATTGEVNGTGTYIYAAWAESPFKYSNAR